MAHRHSLVGVFRHAIRIATAAALAGSFLVLVVLGLGPRTGRYRTLTVLSGSMNPTIPPGSVVFVAPIPLPDVHVGEVITYQAPLDGHPVVTHRVVQVLQGGEQPVVRTKGDANAGPDPWVARLTGGPAWQVRMSVPRLGYAIQALREPDVRRVLLWIVPFLLAAVWLADIWSPSASDGGDTRSPSTSHT